MKKLALILISLMILPSVLLAAVAGSDLPDAEKIIEKYIEATGGRKAWSKPTTMMAKGTFSMPAMGISATIEAWREAPNKTYNKITSDAFGTMEDGFDGTVAWEKTMMAGSKVKTGSELAVASRMAEFVPMVTWKKFYQSATTIGAEEVDGQDCYVVEFLPKEGEGEPEINYFAKDSGLLLKTTTTMINEMGNISIESFVSDYREVDGLLLAFHSRQILMGMQEIVITFEEQGFGMEIPEGTFDLPADVQALVENQ